MVAKIYYTKFSLQILVTDTFVIQLTDQKAARLIQDFARIYKRQQKDNYFHHRH